MMYGGHLTGWGYLSMGIGTAVLLAFVAVAVFVIVRAAGRPTSAVAAPATPQSLLAGRFARGEIDENEYLGRLRTLGGDGRPPTSA